MSLVFSRQRNLKQKAEAILFSTGIQALIFYRVSHFLSKYWLLNKLRLPLVFYRLNQFFCHVDIDPNTIIGKNFLMPHPNGIVIGGTAVIGDNVTVMQNVTLGSRTIGEEGKRHPTLEKGVFIGPNAIVLGNVTIGENARIGAGSVVLCDVEKEHSIFGIFK